MQRIEVFIDKETDFWVARIVDDVGILGAQVVSQDRDQAVYRLGVEMGRHPERFSRPLAQILTDAE
jgi:hypothetical protein